MQYKVISLINMNNHLLQPGELIDLKESDAAQLLACKAIEVHLMPYQKVSEATLNIKLEN